MRPIQLPLRLVSLLILHLLLAFVTGVKAQQARLLQGTVLDSNRAPVSNARIEFRSVNGTRLATTNEDGRFFFSNIGPGTLLVSYPGFTSVKIQVGSDALGKPLLI